MNKINEIVEQESYIYLSSEKGFSTKQKPIPKIIPNNPSNIIIKKGSVDSNSKRYLSIKSTVDKQKYSTKIKAKEIVNSPYVNISLKTWKIYSVAIVIIKHTKIMIKVNIWCLNIFNFKRYLYPRALHITKKLYKRESKLGEIN